MQALDRVEFARHGADMFLVRGVHAVAPLACLLIQIIPAGKPTTREKVVFDKGEGPLDPCRAISVPALMRHKAESEAFCERLHLGHGNHFPSRAAQHHHMRVVNHDALHHAAHVAQRVGEKHLAVESLERGIDLEEQQARITQHRRSGLRLVLPAAHFDGVRRGVVLHLHT